MNNLEESLLGCLLLGGAEAMRKYAAWLSPEDFGNAIPRRIFERMRDFQRAGREFDLQILTSEFKGEEGISAAYLTGLLNAEYSTSLLSEYIQQLRDERFRINMMNLLAQAKRLPVPDLVGELQA